MDEAVRLDDFQESDNVEDRRGQGSGGSGFNLPIGGGGLGIGGIVVVLLLSWFTGINPLTLIGVIENTGGGGHVSTQAPPPQARQGVPTDASGEFVARVLRATEETWTEIFQQQVNGRSYEPPRLVLFSGATRSGCGAAQSSMGPFYCPNDRKVYLDTRFFEEMRSRFQACPPTQGACAFSQAYVIAHEIGHHVQNILGILPKAHDAEQRARSEAEANSYSVRLELQADCLAGVWAANTQRLRLQQSDVASALQTANAIGDDTLQRRTRGEVVPDSFTHGSSAQRQQWFSTGLQSGQINACNTFQR